MIKVIEKCYCDRCGKETNRTYYSRFSLAIKRFRRKHLITKWNDTLGSQGRYEPSDLCKACARSFDVWWTCGKIHNNGQERSTEEDKE